MKKANLSKGKDAKPEGLKFYTMTAGYHKLMEYVTRL